MTASSAVSEHNDIVAPSLQEWLVKNQLPTTPVNGRTVRKRLHPAEQSAQLIQNKLQLLLTLNTFSNPGGDWKLICIQSLEKLPNITRNNVYSETALQVTEAIARIKSLLADNTLTQDTFEQKTGLKVSIQPMKELVPEIRRTYPVSQENDPNIMSIDDSTENSSFELLEKFLKTEISNIPSKHSKNVLTGILPKREDILIDGGGIVTLSSKGRSKLGGVDDSIRDIFDELLTRFNNKLSSRSI